MNKDWEFYSVHIIESLKRLEKASERSEDMLLKQVHSFDRLEKRVVKLEQDQKWYLRVASVVGAVCGILFNWIAGRHSS